MVSIRALRGYSTAGRGAGEVVSIRAFGRYSTTWVRRAFVSPDEWRSTGCYSGCVTQSISQRELRNDSARILRAVDEGQSFVVTRHERPVAEVVPLHRARVVDLNIVERNFAGSPSVDGDAFMQDIDDAVNQDAEPRA